MSYSDTEFIVSKRKRELRSIIIILRGVPGTGKSTTARALYELFKDSYNYFEGHVRIISRDAIRYSLCNENDEDYENSFKDPSFNTMVRDSFYNQIFQRLSNLDVPNVTIIDTTNTKKADLKQLFWILFTGVRVHRKNYDVYLYTKRHEYGSKHKVPEHVMQKFRQELEESDIWLQKNVQSRIKNIKRICI